MANLTGQDWVNIIAALSSLVAAVGVVIVNLETAKNRAMIQTARSAVQDNTAMTVQTQLDVSAIKQVADETHSLVNGEHGVALKGWANALDTVATLTKDPEVQLAADLVQRKALAHEGVITGMNLPRSPDPPVTPGGP